MWMSFVFFAATYLFFLVEEASNFNNKKKPQITSILWIVIRYV